MASVLKSEIARRDTQKARGFGDRLQGDAHPGHAVTLTALLQKSGDGSAPLGGKVVTFSINKTTLTSATTNASGVAALTVTPPANAAAGNDTITASFAGDTQTLSALGSGTLSIIPKNKKEPPVAMKRVYRNFFGTGMNPRSGPRNLPSQVAPEPAQAGLAVQKGDSSPVVGFRTHSKPMWKARRTRRRIGKSITSRILTRPLLKRREDIHLQAIRVCKFISSRTRAGGFRSPERGFIPVKRELFFYRH